MTIFQSINADPAYVYVVIRAFILFCMGVPLIRYGNHRYHLSTSLDLLFMVILGGTISRGINGSASLVSTLVAITALLLFHKMLAKLSFLSRPVENFLKGKSYLLIKDGKIVRNIAKRFNVTERDIIEQLHQQLNMTDYKLVECAYLERGGRISFIKKGH